jgi:murein L,D-transpeptidase YcbB/YkuD
MVPIRGKSRMRVTLLALLLLSWSAGPASEQSDPRHQRLHVALQEYTRIAEAGGWPTVPAGPTIRPGSRDPRVVTLARRLAITGDLENDSREFTEYDHELQAAVVRFQSRHGLEQDALVGKATLRALNVPAAARSAQLRRNLRRTVQIFDTLHEAFLLINVPAFEVYLVRDGETVWSSRVVVGETEAETPLFESTISSVVLNPIWTVPRSIASEELLPKIQKDPAFIARGGYELLNQDGGQAEPDSIDWAALSTNNFPYTLVQRAGPMNELGQVKFPFPNRFGVCMHDTPKTHLFALASRAFSHGCIRVQNPVGLAEILVEPAGWTREQIDVQLDTGRTRSIKLVEPIPIVVAYLTAAVDETGTAYFYRDVYGLDRSRTAATQE